MKKSIKINENELRNIVKKSITSVLKENNVSRKYPSANEDFNLDTIPMKALDAAWHRYHPYLLTIDHRNPLARKNVVEEGTDYKAQIISVTNNIIKTFKLSKFNVIIKKGNHGLYAAVLTADIDDNADVIENAMESQGFFRSQPTDAQFLSDKKGRTWIDMRFELKQPDDVTDEIHKKYRFIYHFTPSDFEKNVETGGFGISNNNSMFKYSEPRAYFCEGDITENDKIELLNTLYTQAKVKYGNVSNKYTLFKVDLNLIPKNIRFFYDINEPKGVYTTQPVPPSAIVEKTYYTATETEKNVEQP